MRVFLLHVRRHEGYIRSVTGLTVRFFSNRVTFGGILRVHTTRIYGITPAEP